MKAGLPAVVVAGKGFVKTASLVATWAGVPDLPVAEYPGAIQLHADEEIRENIAQVTIDRIVAGLTRPARGGTAGAGGDQQAFLSTGTFEEVNSFFLKRGWTDMLPIVPPSVEKVAEFLKFTDYLPDAEIAILPQANLRATPRNIAVNAVMAGCTPEFMPLLIAAVKAVGEPDFQLINIGSTGNKTPWLLINGPIVKELGIEYGVGSRSQGPNPALGRALGLILNNIAGFRSGETLMATWGGALPWVLAEDDDACREMGWRPYNVERGFEEGSSTVTARTSVYWGGQGRYTSWGGDTQSAVSPKTLASTVLQIAVMHQKRQVMVENTLRFGPRNMVAVLMTPPTARVLANAGYSKKDVERHIWENTRISVRDANRILQNFTDFGLTVHELVQEGSLPEWFDVGPDETIPFFSSADLLDVIVCGDADKDKIMSLWANYNRPVTKAIEFPARWDILLKERGK
ncbi:MAG: hypothetical protein HYX92_15520 [Chloroflexi bacterium]|nr:hypothetical protein [Chloroflexota bacterium]